MSAPWLLPAHEPAGTGRRRRSAQISSSSCRNASRAAKLRTTGRISSRMVTSSSAVGRHATKRDSTLLSAGATGLGRFPDVDDVVAVDEGIDAIREEPEAG